jgi:O-antigen polymerase
MRPTTSSNGIFLIAALFSFGVLLFNLPTMGHNLTPRNLFCWALIAAGITYSGFVILRERSYYWHPHFAWLWLPPVTIAAAAALSPPSPYAHYSLLAVAATLFGTLWVLGLVQFRLGSQQFKQLAWLIFAGSAISALMTLGSPGFFNFIPHFDQITVLLKATFGGFQQVNSFSSFMAAITVFGFVTFVHSADNRRPVHQAFLFVLTLICSCAVWTVGSRTGYLGLGLSALLLAIWIWKFQSAQKFNLLIWLGALALALLISLHAHSFGVAPQYWIGERLVDLPKGVASTERKDMWLVSLSLWWQAPLFGHGLGSFTQIFTNQFDQLVASGRELKPIYGALTHPHNESLLWLAETGLVGFIGIFGPWLYWIFIVCRKDPAFGLSWLACLLPIALHTQTEFPLHNSSAHWFLLGLILTFGFAKWPITPRAIQLARPIWLLMTSVWLTVGLMTSAFLIQSGYLSHVLYARFYWPDNQQQGAWTSRVNSSEFFHPLLDEFAKDIFVLNASHWVLESNDPNLIQQWLPAVEGLYRRYPTPDAKKRLSDFQSAAEK